MHLSRPMIISGGILLLLFATSLILFPHLPETLASHWDAHGVADGYLPKAWSLFLLPVMALGLTLLLLLLPRLDPLRENIEEFRDTYEWFVAGILLFFLYLHLLTLAWNLGFRFSMVQALCPAFALLYFACGVLIGHAKRNWFIGIRTPWTLSSDRVWAETHRLGALLFKVCGFLVLGGVLLPDLAILFILVPVLAASAYLVVFSYIEFQKERVAGPREISK
jgi:immunity protein, SdpI family